MNFTINPNNKITNGDKKSIKTSIKNMKFVKNRLLKENKSRADSSMLNASTGEIKPASAFQRNSLTTVDLETRPEELNNQEAINQDQLIESAAPLDQVIMPEQNVEDMPFVELAEQFEQARSKIIKLLINLPSGMAMMAREYISSIENGVSPSELFSLNRSEINRNRFNESSGTHSAKQIEAQIAAVFKRIDTQSSLSKPAKDTRDQIRFIACIHFLPIFLLQASTRVLNQSIENKERGSSSVVLNNLATEMKRINKLRSIMVTSNIGLVKFMARQYKTQHMTPEDLQQEGVIGLLKAVDRFDFRRQLRFSTYATYWVRQTITRSMSKTERLIRIPINLAPKAPAVFQMLDSKLSETNRLPSVTELAELCGLTENEVSTILEFYKPIISLDGDSKDDNDVAVMIDFLEQKQFPSAIESISTTALQDRLVAAVNSLSEKEAKVIRCRYGLENQTEMTLQDIANTLQVTRERVRQIQNSGLKKLQVKFGCQLSTFLRAE